MLKFFCLFVVCLDLVFGDGHKIRPVLQVSLPSDTATSESVEYDSYNQLLFYQSFYEGIIYVADYNASEIAAGTYNLSSQEEMDNGNYTVIFPTGMYSNGTYLIVVSAANGYVTGFDIENKFAIEQLEITYYGSDTRLNGICNDPTDDNIIYVTGPGADFVYTSSYTNDSALYRIDIVSGNWTMLYDFGGDEHPNGCAVSPDGDYVYMVSFWLDGSGRFLRYNVSDGSYTQMSGIEVNGDGIVFDNDGNLYFTTWNSNETNGYLSQIYGFDSGDNVTYEIIATGVGSPADCSYDGDNNWIVIPEFYGPPGAIAWINLNELDETTTTMMADDTTTAMMTDETTTTMESTMMDSTMESTMTTSDTEPPSTDSGNHILLSMYAMVVVVLSVLLG